MHDEILTGANPAGDARLMAAILGEDVRDPHSEVPLVANGPDSIDRIPTCSLCGQARPTHAAPDVLRELARLILEKESLYQGDWYRKPSAPPMDAPDEAWTTYAREMRVCAAADKRRSEAGRAVTEYIREHRAAIEAAIGLGDRHD